MAEGLEPVEIEIYMRQNVSEESQRAAENMANLGRASEEALNKLQAEIEKQTSVIKQMRSVIEELQNQIAATPPDLVPPETVSRLEATMEALDAVTQTVSDYQEAILQMNEAVAENADITGLITEATDGLSESEQGLIDTVQEIIEAQQELSEATQENTENTEENSEATEENTIKDMLMEKAIGEICNQLGIENQALVSAVVNTNNLAKAKGMWTKATSLLNTQLGISIGLSKLLVGAGIGVLLAAIAGLIYLYKEWKEKQEEVNQALADSKKVTEAAEKSSANLVVTFTKMKKEWNALGDNLKEKEKYIRDNKASFDHLGTSIHSVLDAENIFVNNADTFQESILLRAKAAASFDLAVEKYKLSLDKMREAEERRNDPGITDRVKSGFRDKKSFNLFGVAGSFLFGNKTAEEFAKEAADELKNEGEKAEESFKKLIDQQIKLEDEASELLKKAGINSAGVITEGTKAFYEKMKSDASIRMAALKDSQKDSEEWQQAVSEYNEATGKLKLWDIAGQQSSSESAANKAKTESEKNRKEAEQAGEDLAKKSIDFQNRIAAARIATMKDGYEKERATIQAEYAREKVVIINELNEIAKLEKKTGKPAIRERQEIIELDVVFSSAYEARIKKLNEESQKAISDIFSNVDQRFNSELDNNLQEIDRYYNEQTRLAKEAGATIGQINELCAKQEKEKSLSYIDHSMRKNDLDEEIELIRAQGLQSAGLTELYEKRRLEISLLYGQRRLALLKQSVSEGNIQAKEEMVLLEENLNTLRSSLNKPVSVKGILDEKVFNRLKQHFLSLNQSEEEAEENTQKFFNAFHNGGAIASAVIGEIKNILGGMNETLDMTLDAAMNIAQGFAEGGIVGGIQAAASSLISTTVKLLSAKKEVDKSMIEGYEAYIKAIDKLIDKQIKSLESLGATGIYETINKTVEDLNKKLEASRRLFEEVGRSGSGAFSHSLGHKANKMLSGYNSQLKQAGISTTDIYKMTNKELITLQQLPEVWAKLHGDLRKYIEDLSDAQDELDDIDNKLKELVMGLEYSQVTDAIVDSLTDPSIDNAMLDLEGKIDNMIGSIIKNILTKNMLVEPVKNMVEELWKSVDIGGNSISFDPDAMKKFKKEVLNQAELFQGAWGEWSGIFSDLGIGFEESADTARKGASKGIATASQDSIDELNGGIYALRQSVNDIRNIEKEALIIQRAREVQLNRIVENSEFCRFLQNIKEDINELNTRGVKIRD